MSIPPTEPSPAKVIEESLELPDTEWIGRHAGLFQERPPYVAREKWKDLGPAERRAKEPKDLEPMLMRFVGVPVKHDQGLGLIYAGALAGWAYLIAYGVLSVPAPTNSWVVQKWWIGLLGALVGVGTFVLVRWQFLQHDKHRFRPGKRGYPPVVIDGTVSDRAHL